MLECTFIIVNYNNPLLIKKCLESIDHHLKDLKKEIIIVDNNSHDQELKILQSKYNYLKIIFLHVNTGFGFANNIGSKNSQSDILIFLNSDTQIIDSSLIDAVRLFKKLDKEIIWAPIVCSPDGKFQNSYHEKVTYSNFLVHFTPLQFFSKYNNFLKKIIYFEKEFKEITEVDVVFGVMMLIRKCDFEKICGFSKNYFMYLEDVDFCDRFKENLLGKIYVNPAMRIIHEKNGSEISKTSTRRMQRKSKIIYGLNKFGYSRILLFILVIYFLENLIKLINFLSKTSIQIESKK